MSRAGPARSSVRYARHERLLSPAVDLRGTVDFHTVGAVALADTPVLLVDGETCVRNIFCMLRLINSEVAQTS